MRVLQIGSSLFDWGGIERYVYYLSEGLVARGHEVFVACPDNSPLFARCGEKAIPYSQRGQFKFSTVPKWLRLFRNTTFDIVHVHFSPDFVIPARIAKRVGKQPIVMTRHLATKWNATKSKAYSATFDRFIAVSDAVGKTLIEDSGIEKDKIVVAKAGCPSLHPSRTRSEMADELKLREFNVGFFGRLALEKGVDTLIDAARELPQEVGVHIFGDGPEKDALKQRAKGTGCRFHGYVPDVDNALGAMDVVAIPSRWAEAFPYSALEAMSLGKPIIASNVGGLPEQVEDRVSGLLVQAESAGGLRDAILYLYNHDEERKAMGLRASYLHGENFTIEKFAERIEAVYMEALCSRNF